MTDSKLTKYEMACLTAQVPMTGDPKLDQIISTSLRLKIATEILNGLVANNPHGASCSEALKWADILLRQFGTE